MVERTYVFRLGSALRDAVCAALSDPLERVIADDGLRAGLLEGLLQALNDAGKEGTSSDVPVTLRETPSGVELEIARGSVRDTLVCTV